jgi:hypothetical protein
MVFCRKLFLMGLYETLSAILLCLFLVTACSSQDDITEVVVTVTPIVNTLAHPKILGEKPEPRHAPAMTYDSTRRVIVLYGGTTPKETLTDTWYYDGTQWELVETGHPTANSDPLMAYDENRQKMVLFNWYAEEIWEYDGEIWKRINLPTRLPVNVPAITYDPIQKRIIIFGEIGDGRAYETWEYDGENMELLDRSHYHDWGAKGFSANRILFPAMVYDNKNQEIILQPPYQWTFVFRNNIWKVKINDTQSSLPDCAYCIWPKLVYDVNRELVVMFDGEHTWEFVGGNWVKMGMLISPTPRSDYAMAYDQARGLVVLFGGITKEGIYLNDTWEYDGTTWVQR